MFSPGREVTGLPSFSGRIFGGCFSGRVTWTVGRRACRSLPWSVTKVSAPVRHRSPAAGALHQPHPDGAHHRPADAAGRVGESVRSQQCSVAVGAFVAVGEMFGGFQPSQLVQLPGGEGVQPFIAQTAVFTEQFHLKSPPFRRRSAARPASFLPGRPAPPLFSGACRRAGRLRRRCAVPAA